MTWLHRLAGLCLLPAGLLALPSLWAGFVAAAVALWATPQGWPFVLAMAPGVLLARWSSRQATWWSTFEHELTHAVTGIPFLLFPVGFVVTRDRGGLVKQFTPPLPIFLLPVPLVGAYVSGLAPYSVPLFAFGAALFMEFGEQWAYPLANASVLGILVGYHAYSNLHELRHNSAPGVFADAEGNATHGDIARCGYLVSAVLVPAVWLGTHGIILTVLARTGVPGLLYWGEGVVRGTLNTTQHVIGTLVGMSR